MTYFRGQGCECRSRQGGMQLQGYSTSHCCHMSALACRRASIALRLEMRVLSICKKGISAEPRRYEVQASNSGRDSQSQIISSSSRGRRGRGKAYFEAACACWAVDNVLRSKVGVWYTHNTTARSADRIEPGLRRRCSLCGRGCVEQKVPSRISILDKVKCPS